MEKVQGNNTTHTTYNLFTRPPWHEFLVDKMALYTLCYFRLRKGLWKSKRGLLISKNNTAYFFFELVYILFIYFLCKGMVQNEILEKAKQVRIQRSFKIQFFHKKSITEMKLIFYVHKERLFRVK